MPVNKSLIELCDCQKTKIGKLRQVMIETVISNTWVTHVELAKLSGIKLSDGVMELIVKANIGIVSQQQGTVTYYQMQVPPSRIDWDYWRRKASTQKPMAVEEEPAPVPKKQGKLI
jgi:hypothetical protein